LFVLVATVVGTRPVARVVLAQSPGSRRRRPGKAPQATSRCGQRGR